MGTGKICTCGGGAATESGLWWVHDTVAQSFSHLVVVVLIVEWFCRPLRGFYFSQPTIFHGLTAEAKDYRPLG